MGIGDMLQAQVDAEDAARYRWLREHCTLVAVDVRKHAQQIEIVAKVNRENLDGQALDKGIERLMRIAERTTGES